SDPSSQKHRTELDSIFMLLENNIVTFVKHELRKMHKVLSQHKPPSLETENEDVMEEAFEKEMRNSKEAFEKITLNFLRRMKQEELADRLQSRTPAGAGSKLKSSLKKKFQSVFEGIAKAGSPTLLNQIYTELYITEGGTGEVNDEHEVRQIEAASRKPHRPETTIRQEDIFKVPPGRDEPVRTVMTKGVAGIGKTVLTQKFTLDWAEDKVHQNIQFIFPFTFRELNVLREKKFSLVELVHHFFTETKGICSFEHFQVLFIFDGLDESRLPLDFHNQEILTDATESSSVDVLLTNLIRGKLLPSALLWITTRPAAANQIPPQCVGMVTEVRGFNVPQKEEYFRKRFRGDVSVQEFLAALHVHLTFINSGVNLMQIDQPTSDKFTTKTKEPKSLHENAVDKALGSTNGHLDLFLRFFLGLSLQSNQSLLLDLFTQTKSSTETRCKTVQYIKEKISENVSAEKSINLFHCLNELNDRSLVEEIQQSLSSGSLSKDELSPSQWSALAYILLSSGQDLDEFDLKKYSASQEAFLRLLPVIKISSKALLSVCDLSVRSCAALSTVLRAPLSCLRELDLSNNNLQDEGVKLVAAGLKTPTCKLQILRLSGCLVTEEGCLVLAAALTFNPSHLRELDLSYNHPGNTGVEVLSAHLEDPGCTLENLRVEPAGVQWLTPGLRKYSCQLSIDTNTVSRKMRISGDGRKVTHVAEDELYPDHPDRFDVPPQFLCRDGLSGRGYWEVEWGGQALLAVSYKKIERKGNTHNCLFAWNDHSWSLRCSDNGVFSVLQNKAETTVSASSSSVSNRVAVYVDCPAGTLSFYRVSSGSLVHLHTFNTTFTEPLYPGFGFGLLYTSGSWISLCPTE
uniref:B30.2/SPRY domain-containing protein n=1 Tax=Poecilia formosa TaxID=48698 RepID=A0A087Y2Q4_POEFO